MGQVALGFRSLAIKGAVFFVLAALLVWILGGKLFPRPEIADSAGVSFAGDQWYWRVAVGGDRPGRAVWTLMVRKNNDPVRVDDRVWADVAGPVVAGEWLVYGGRTGSPGAGGGDAADQWRLERRDDEGQVAGFAMPDRLALEQQLERLRAGLPVQDAATIASQRRRVLDPGED